MGKGPESSLPTPESTLPINASSETPLQGMFVLGVESIETHEMTPQAMESFDSNTQQLRLQEGVIRELPQAYKWPQINNETERLQRIRNTRASWEHY